MAQPGKRLKANKVIEGQRCGWSGTPIHFGDDVVICTACDTPHLAAYWDEKQGCSLTTCENAPLKQMGGQQPGTGRTYPRSMTEQHQPLRRPPPGQPPGQPPQPPPPGQTPLYQPPQPPAERVPAQPLGAGTHEQMAARRAQARTRQYMGGRPGMTNCPHCGRPIREDAEICRYCKRAPTPDGVYRGPTVNAPGAQAALIFGILGLLCCPIIFGVLAIVKANEAKRAIAEDPRYGGGGMATAGLVLGIIGLVFFVIQLLVGFAGGGFNLSR